jgi:hypothetical protein
MAGGVLAARGGLALTCRLNRGTWCLWTKLRVSRSPWAVMPWVFMDKLSKMVHVPIEKLGFGSHPQVLRPRPHKPAGRGSDFTPWAVMTWVFHEQAF